MSDIPNTEQEMAVDTTATESEGTVVQDSPSKEVSEEVVVSDESSKDVKLDQSDRAKSRQRELANRLKDSEIEKAKTKEEVETLRKELESYKVGSEKSDEPDSSNLEAGTEVSFDQLDQYIEKKTRKRVDELLSIRDRKEQHRRAFEKGVSLIESKYKELNPDSDSFDPLLSKTVTRLYVEASKSNPGVDVHDFVENVMSVREMGADKAVSEVKKETVLQEAASAVTPSSEKVVTQTDEEKLLELMKSGKMTAKEAEKYLQ